MAGNGHLVGRVVVITGGAGGFGRLLASGAATRDAKVVVSDVDGDGAKPWPKVCSPTATRRSPCGPTSPTSTTCMRLSVLQSPSSVRSTSW